MGGGNYSRKKIIKNLFQLHIIESTHSKQKKAGNFLNTLFPVLIVLTDDFLNCKPHQYKSHGPVFQGRTLGKAGVRARVGLATPSTSFSQKLRQFTPNPHPLASFSKKTLSAPPLSDPPIWSPYVFTKDTMPSIWITSEERFGNVEFHACLKAPLTYGISPRAILKIRYSDKECDIRV